MMPQGALGVRLNFEPRKRQSRRKSKALVVLVVCANPFPIKHGTNEFADSPVVLTDTCRPAGRINAFEVKRWMERIFLPQQIILSRKQSDVRRIGDKIARTLGSFYWQSSLMPDDV